MSEPAADLAATEVCVFDAYGTLFDVHAAVARHVAALGAEAAALSATWRERQLAYAWLRSMMGHHQDFWAVTGDALDFALERHGIHDSDLRERLLGAYWECAAYPEVGAVLARLRDDGHRLAILSNGAPAMLEAAIRSAGLTGLFEAALSVEDVGVFKPAGATYGLVGARMGVAPASVCFVSSNGWDAHAGAAFGFRSVWVNRHGLPWERLPGRPAAVVDSLADLPNLLRR